jgi:hypothetical protein
MPYIPDSELRTASLIGHLVDGRECGSCTACCDVFDVPELDKPNYVRCSYCTDFGCGIYETRPEVCRTYFCLWRRIDAMPDLARPDRIGIVFSIVTGHMPVSPFERLYIIARAIDDPAVFETPAGRAAIRMFVREGSLPVFTAFGDEKKQVYPDQAFREAILDPLNPKHAALATAAIAWRKSYGMPDNVGGDATNPDPGAQRGYTAVNVSAPAESSANS